MAAGLEVLSLQNTAVTDAGLKPLNKLSKLKSLHLGGCKAVTGSGFADLPDLAALEVLYLNDTATNDAGMKAVARLREVKTLDLDRTKITDAGVRELATPRGLVSLSVEETAVGDAGLIAVAEKAKKLERAGVKKSKVTEKGAADARSKATNLTVSFD